MSEKDMEVKDTVLTEEVKEEKKPAKKTEAKKTEKPVEAPEDFRYVDESTPDEAKKEEKKPEPKKEEKKAEPKKEEKPVADTKKEEKPVEAPEVSPREAIRNTANEKNNIVSSSYVGKSVLLSRPTKIYRGPSIKLDCAMFGGLVTVEEKVNEFYKVTYVKSAVGKRVGYIRVADIEVK